MFTKALVYGSQIDAIQRMLDFDYLCNNPISVGGIISDSQIYHKFFWGKKEIIIPTYGSRDDCNEKDIDTLINFASHRTAGDITKQALASGYFKNIIVIAEGIPERVSREIIALNKQYPTCRIIGPSTVGGIVAGKFRIGNTGGSIENMISSKLFTQGSIGFVSKSGGMSNEMYRIISDNSDGIHTGITIGGDRYPYTTFEEVILYYQSINEIKIIIVLGEVGNTLELRIGDLIKEGSITKPVIAWVTGNSSELLQQEIQFGHAGSKANSELETANYKNTYLRDCGAIVPTSFNTLPDLICKIYEQSSGKSLYEIQQIYNQKANELIDTYNNIIQRKHTLYTSSITNERGKELLYNNIPISDFVENGSIANTIGHLWFKKQLPQYALDFINTTIILTADHGPGVSGAVNTIVTARAGKDVSSSVIAGLATIGPRFGGAIQATCEMLFDAKKQNITAEECIDLYKKKGEPIPGIGHKIKSKYNPDTRCQILYEIIEKFPSKSYFNFALAVENLTLEKKSSLILNIDGYIAAALLDMMISMGLSHDEIAMYIKSGLCNGIFIAARTLGFIGHHIDQNRLHEGLYRTPENDILYL